MPRPLPRWLFFPPSECKFYLNKKTSGLTLAFLKQLFFLFMTTDPIQSSLQRGKFLIAENGSSSFGRTSFNLFRDDPSVFKAFG